MKYLSLTAGDLCTRTVAFTDAGMQLAEAARLMRKHHVGSLVVVQERSPAERLVVGMITTATSPPRSSRTSAIPMPSV